MSCVEVTDWNNDSSHRRAWTLFVRDSVLKKTLGFGPTVASKTSIPYMWNLTARVRRLKRVGNGRGEISGIVSSGMTRIFSGITCSKTKSKTRLSSMTTSIRGTLYGARGNGQILEEMWK